MIKRSRFLCVGDQVTIGMEEDYSYDPEYECCLKRFSTGKIKYITDVGNWARGNNYFQYTVQFPCGHKWPYEKEELT